MSGTAASSVLVLHGPNLNRLGTREPEVYGSLTLSEIDQKLRTLGADLGLELRTLQSNHEGALIDALHESADRDRGVILNAGGFTHTSVALRDAIASIPIPVIEVHLSNIFAREPFRHASLISPVCSGVISGLGLQSYTAALRVLSERLG